MEMCISRFDGTLFVVGCNVAIATLLTSSVYRVYTVRLLSFRTGIIKSICVKKMTLPLFSFRHTSLLTVHTDLHVHTASGWFVEVVLCNGV